MKSNPTRRKWTAWLASLVILLASLAPSLSHALALGKVHALQQAGLMDRLAQEQTCHSGDAQPELPKSAPLEHGQHDPLASMEHCPFCLMHGSSHGPPPSAQKFLPLPDLAPEWLPGRSAIFLAQQTPWRFAVSRAPPFVL